MLLSQHGSTGRGSRRLPVLLLLLILVPFTAGCYGDDTLGDPTPVAEINYRSHLEPEVVEDILERDGWTVEQAPPNSSIISAEILLRQPPPPEGQPSLVKALVGWSETSEETSLTFKYISTYWEDIQPWEGTEERQGDVARAIMAPWMAPVMEAIEEEYGPPDEEEYFGGATT